MLHSFPTAKANAIIIYPPRAASAITTPSFTCPPLRQRYRYPPVQRSLQHHVAARTRLRLHSLTALA